MNGGGDSVGWWEKRGSYRAFLGRRSPQGLWPKLLGTSARWKKAEVWGLGQGPR